MNINLILNSIKFSTVQKQKRESCLRLEKKDASLISAIIFRSSSLFYFRKITILLKANRNPFCKIMHEIYNKTGTKQKKSSSKKRIIEFE